MFFLYEIFLILVLILFFLSYSRLKINDKIKSLQHQNIIVHNLIDTIDDGFYIWDSKKRIEKFSPNLLILFNTVFYSFHEFVNFFEQSESLMKNFAEAKEINKSFTLELKAKDSEVYCICYGRSIIDNSNNIVGALLWIRNISDFKIKANELELENKKFTKEIEDYKSLINSLPYPIVKYNEHRKIKFYNSFYDKYINITQKSYITRNINNNQSIKHTVTYKNEHKIFHFIKVPIQQPNEIIVYGYDISSAEKLHSKLNDHLTTQKNLLEGLSIAIAIYSKNQKLKFYNNSFVKVFQLDQKFLLSYPTYHEIILHLFESRKLLDKKNFQAIEDQRTILFKELLEMHNEVLQLTNGTTLRVFTIPYATEGLLFSYEEYKKSPSS